VTTHNASEQLREEAITLPQNHVLRKLVPIGLLLGVIGLAATFALSSMYTQLWTPAAAHYGKAKGHEKHKAKDHAHKKGKKGHKHDKKGKKAGKKGKKAGKKGKKATTWPSRKCGARTWSLSCSS